MSKRTVSNLMKHIMKYLCCAAFVAVLVTAYLSPRGYDEAAQVDKYLMLCDAFTIPGIVLIMVGALVWVSTTGFLDGLAYCIRFAIFSLIPGKRLERDEKYADYVERKSEKRMKGYGFLFWSGIATLIVSFVFMALFYSLYE